MKFMKFLIALAIMGFGMSSVHATDGTTGNASYVGHLHDGTIFDEVTLTNGADWFNLFMVAGQQITINVTRGDAGNLIPNISVFNGEATPGQTIFQAGLTEQFYGTGTSSNSSASFKTLVFTPTATKVWTLIVSTWTGQTGTYDISCAGCGNMPNANVSEPSILAILGASLLALVMVRRRKVLQK